VYTILYTERYVLTAEIAILNTHGVSIAADSAITLRLNENEQKIYNSANKVFALSKYHPVGIMIYNNATFMGTIDWEILIKEYRKSLGEKSYKTLFEYANNFKKFILSYKFIKSDLEKKFLLSLCYGFFSFFREKFFGNLEEILGNHGNISRKEIDKVFNDTINSFIEIHKNTPDEKLFKIDPENIILYKKDIIDIIQIVFEKYSLSNTQCIKMLNLVSKEIQKRIGYTGFYTGIVITGFGNDEIFPSIYSCQIHGKLGKCLIITNEQKEQISNDMAARIIPFAQSEMVSSFMEGIDPDFENEIEDQLKSLMSEMENIVDKSHKKKLSLIEDSFLDYIKNYKWDNFINPVMNIVASLQKTELAEMAESLVNLTSFKKQVSKESETVGGPIDVAVITKGDGFIWIKRKHYFDMKLNNHFLNNYFNGGRQ
jgi:20S proteasome alpha/beta subunit